MNASARGPDHGSVLAGATTEGTMGRSLIRPMTLCLLVVAVILLVAARAHNSQQSPMNRPLTPREKAIQAVRVINSAEYDYRNEHNRFGSWDEVYASGAVTNLEQTWPRMKDLSIASGSEVIPGFRLTLLVAEDGADYSLSLHEMEGHGCGISVFSDQSGLIYQGAVIDCPQVVDTPTNTPRPR
jgi:hypothetical protein